MAGVSGVERFGVQEARQRFPELLVRASKGERLVIQRHRQDLAAIVPLEDAGGGTSSQETMENLLSLKGSAQKRSAPAPSNGRNQCLRSVPLRLQKRKH